MTFRVFTTSTCFFLLSSVFFFLLLLSLRMDHCQRKFMLVMVSKINKSARKSRRWEDYWLSILMQSYSFHGFFFFFLVEIRNHNQQSSRENMKWEPKLSSAVSSILIVCFYNGAVRCVPLCLSGNLGRDMKILNPRPIKTSLERRWFFRRRPLKKSEYQLKTNDAPQPALRSRHSHARRANPALCRVGVREREVCIGFDDRNGLNRLH